MKLEYVADGSPDCPLIRIYDFDEAEAAQLQAVIAGLANGQVDKVAVHELPAVESVGGCRLVLRIQSRNHAVVRTGKPAQFECRFTRSTWDNVAGLVEPFVKNASGFQWLANSPGEARLLLSSSGSW